LRRAINEACYYEDPSPDEIERAGAVHLFLKMSREIFPFLF
jgi:hypothetical protein